MKNKIIVIVGVSGNNIIAGAYYYHIPHLLVDKALEFRSYQYSKYLFGVVGKELGGDLFFEARKVGVSLLDEIYFHNESDSDLMEIIFDHLSIFSSLLPIDSQEMEMFTSGFRKGLKC